MRLLPILLLAGCGPPSASSTDRVSPKQVESVQEQEVEIATLLARANHPTSLCVDATHVYWTDWYPWTSGSTGVWKVDKNGDDKPQQLIHGFHELDPKPRALRGCLLNGEELWFSTIEGVVAVPTAGGPLRNISPRSGSSLVHGPDGAYLASADGLFRLEPEETMAAQRLDVGKLHGGDRLIYTQRAQSHMEEKYTEHAGTSVWVGTGEKREEVSVGAQVMSIARRGESLYIVSLPTSGHPALHRVQLGEVEKGMTTLLESNEVGWPLVAGTDALYWIAGIDVFQFPLEGKEPEHYVRSSRRRSGKTDRLHSLVVTDEALFWVWEQCDFSCYGRIMTKRLP